MYIESVRSSNIPYNRQYQKRTQGDIQYPAFDFSAKSSPKQQTITSNQHAKSIHTIVDMASLLPSIHILTDQEREQFFETDTNSNSLAESDPNIQNNKDLSAEQIKNLKNRYDVSDMDQQQQVALLRELTDLGVISKEDFLRSGRIKLDPRMIGVLQKTSSVSPKLIDTNNIFEKIQNAIDMEMEQYNYMEREYGKGSGSKEVLEYAQSHQRILDILEQLR